MPFVHAAETDTMPTSGKYADAPTVGLLGCDAAGMSGEKVEVDVSVLVIPVIADADASLDT